MEIKEAVEIFRTESQKLLCDGAERDFQAYSKAIYVISNALKGGYTLCKVDEAVEKMEKLMQQENEGEMYYYPPYYSERCIKILKEACK